MRVPASPRRPATGARAAPETHGQAGGVTGPAPEPMRTSMKATLLTGVAIAIAAPAFAQDRAAVLTTYAELAEAKYSDSLTLARALQTAIGDLIAQPSAAALAGAKDAWLAAR